MRRRVLLGLAGGAVLSAVALTRGAGRNAPSASLPAVNPVPNNTPLTLPAVAAESPLLQRNPFRYVDERRSLPGGALGGTRASPLVSPLTSPQLPSPAPVSLVGLVRQAGEVRAALSIEGQVEIAAVGDEVSGYRVLSIDDESSVRLRGPDGVERTIAPLP